MNDRAIIETNYLPSVSYFCLIHPFESISIEGFEFFEKQTSRNRCYVNTSQGVVMLSVPLDGRHGKVLTKDVKIDAGTQWRNTHWRTIESSYRKAPFFEFYCDELKSILYKGHEYLFELNLDLLSFCLQSLKMKNQITATVSYEEQVEGLDDLRNCLSGKKSNHPFKNFQVAPYQQVFGNSFANNLSVIDLLFCSGHESLQIIKMSQRAQEI